MNKSSYHLTCPICSHRFSQVVKSARSEPVFGFGLDYRLVPRDTWLASEVATCPNCKYAQFAHEFDRRAPGQVRLLVRSKEYANIFKRQSEEDSRALSWRALIAVLGATALNPRDLGIMSVKGSWVARELCCLETEDRLLSTADYYLEEALRRGLTKGDPGMVMYLLGEINRRRGAFLRGREMLTFLGNNPKYRYPALLLTVLIEEEDVTPYWSLHAPDKMEERSPQFKGLFPPLRSIPPGKTEFSDEELADRPEQPGEDDGRRF